MIFHDVPWSKSKLGSSHNRSSQSKPPKQNATSIQASEALGLFSVWRRERAAMQPTSLDTIVICRQVRSFASWAHETHNHNIQQLWKSFGEFLWQKRFVLSTKKAKANARRKEGGPLAFNLNITICPPTTHNQLTSPPAPQYDLSDLRRGRHWRVAENTKRNRIWPYLSLQPFLQWLTICIYIIYDIYIYIIHLYYILFIYIHILLEHV